LDELDELVELADVDLAGFFVGLLAKDVDEKQRARPTMRMPRVPYRMMIVLMIQVA